MKNKRGQLTIFIIIAIVIVAILVVLFYPKIKLIIKPVTAVSYIDQCVKENVKDTVGVLMARGGSLNPVNSITYSDNQVEYLCYTNKYYQTCSIQQPLLKQHIERELRDDINGKVKMCVESFKEEMRKRGYSVGGKDVKVNVEIVPDNIIVNIDAGIVLEKESIERYDKIRVNYKSGIYDLVMLSSSILNWEARYGDSDPVSYMLYYPDIKVEKIKKSDGSKIYALTDKITEEKFVFASRSLSWPGGYGVGKIEG